MRRSGEGDLADLLSGVAVERDKTAVLRRNDSVRPSSLAWSWPIPPSTWPKDAGGATSPASSGLETPSRPVASNTRMSPVSVPMNSR
jgi:hypothetical protein